MDDTWITAMVEASNERANPGLGDATVAFTIGKTKQLTFVVAGGQVVSGAPLEQAQVKVPFKKAQLEAVVQGEQSLAQEFIRGDIKPEGSTGAFASAVELFEDELFRSRFAALVGAEQTQ